MNQTEAGSNPRTEAEDSALYILCSLTRISRVVLLLVHYNNEAQG